MEEYFAIESEIIYRLESAESLSQPTDAKVRDKIENYVDCQIIHGNIDKSEFSWLYAVCEHWFSEGRVNTRAFNQEAIPVPVDDLREAVQTLLDGIEFIRTEYNASYVITTPDVAMLKQAMSSKEAIPDRQPSPQIFPSDEEIEKEADILFHIPKKEDIMGYRHMTTKRVCWILGAKWLRDRQPSPSGGDAIEFGEWIHEQGYEPWGVTGLWHNIANHKIIPDKIFTTEQLYQQFKETTSNKVTKGDK